MTRSHTTEKHVSATARTPGTRGTRRPAIRWHRWLSYLGLASLLIWGGSGLLHPVMTNFGPQAEQLFPPRIEADLTGAMRPASLIEATGIRQALAIRLAQTPRGSLLQVTDTESAPRRYFRLHTGAEVVGEDERYAVDLARHYLGSQVAGADVAQLDFIEDFSKDYPWVNRLLPVYRVRFDTADELTAWIYTETGALAAVSNSFKTRVQRAFSLLHTWEWVPQSANALRIAGITLLVSALALLGVSGLVLLATLRRRWAPGGIRGSHRIAAWALGGPVLMLSISGLYHLLYSAAAQPAAQLRFSGPMNLTAADLGATTDWPTQGELPAGTVLSLVKNAGGRLLFRISLPPSRGAHHAAPEDLRDARFDGVPATGPAMYLDARSGAPWLPGDREFALQLAEQFSGQPPSNFHDVSLVTGFGPNYDFRNKRLPVWRIDLAEPAGESLFVDTTGVLADRITGGEALERLSFSLLHKWNFLAPLGRTTQSIVISLAVIASIVILGGLGLLLQIRRWRR